MDNITGATGTPVVSRQGRTARNAAGTTKIESPKVSSGAKTTLVIPRFSPSDSRDDILDTAAKCQAMTLTKKSVLPSGAPVVRKVTGDATNQYIVEAFAEFFPSDDAE